MIIRQTSPVEPTPPAPGHPAAGTLRPAATPSPAVARSGEGALPRMIGGVLTITAYGTPAPQGSKRHVGRGVMIESSKKVKPWREAVKHAALEVLSGTPPLDGPLLVEFVFTLTRPKSAPKSRIHPDRMPDLSKLIRATEDALTDAGAWTDDARIVRFKDPRKVYVGAPDPDALHIPGAVIRVWPMEAL